MERYLLEFNGRYDGSSKFPTNQQWAFFPSASVGWRVSEESFWKVSPDLISNLKLRLSYGSLGNGNIDAYSFTEISPSISPDVSLMAYVPSKPVSRVLYLPGLPGKLLPPEILVLIFLCSKADSPLPEIYIAGGQKICLP